jgi:hypothetical protein
MEIGVFITAVSLMSVLLPRDSISNIDIFTAGFIGLT